MAIHRSACPSHVSRRRRQRRPYQSAPHYSLLILLLTSSLHHGSCLVHDAAKFSSFLPATDRAPLRRDDPTSPYALTLRVQPFTPIPSPTQSSSSSSPAIIELSYNFLATQVWPSARVAALAVETYLPANDHVETVCEFGCGPGLPSLAAAVQFMKISSRESLTSNRSSLRRVIATDLDPIALELVKRAALEQDLDSILTVQPFDLVGTKSDAPSSIPPSADLYLLADVFESSSVARGAARITSELLLRHGRGRCEDPRPCHVWVFAQTDRAQRDVYLEDMKRLLGDESLSWCPVESGPPAWAPRSMMDRKSNRPSSRLWLCDVDETKVKY